MKVDACSSKIVKYFEALELFAFLFCGIGLNSASVVVGECEKILFVSKVHWRNWLHKISVNVLLRLFGSLLRGTIILFSGFCLFIAIAYKSFCVVDKLDIVTCKVFF